MGKYLKQVLLEWFYMGKEPISIIKLYVLIDDIYFSILCSEENVIIKKQEKKPLEMTTEQFCYIPIEKQIDWLPYCEIISIDYLLDKYNIRRGVLFEFTNNHNFIYYNAGYEIDENSKFDTDIIVAALPYRLGVKN